MKPSAAVWAVAQSSGYSDGIEALIQAAAVEVAGRTLTEEELAMVAEHLPQAKMRQLQFQLAENLTTPCRMGVMGRLFPMMTKFLGQQMKAAFSCLGHAVDGSKCKKARATMRKLEADMKADCMKDSSSVVCVWKGAKVKGKKQKSEDLCLPKKCQNSADIKLLDHDG
eukprot:CAMPEP_0180812046 /NCGR_PEP_ID=MMETSP1038_2-20121128/65776_1 /TAXON_ID=632150 /ORGANISM="Azadinium spinosum, Strain 3D9" /LENGTH=167 /DNA_ID=CAMNT_0022853511 /DNA_START=115 /DNA_END=615 /DNA_ORIENTATION=-